MIAVLDFLPLFGTGTVLLPWAAVKLLSGEYMLAAGLAMLYVVSQVTRQMVQPKIVGDSMGVKASGGIRDRQTAEKMLKVGASRLGTSATTAICS